MFTSSPDVFLEVIVLFLVFIYIYIYIRAMHTQYKQKKPYKIASVKAEFYKSMSFRNAEF